MRTLLIVVVLSVLAGGAGHAAVESGTPAEVIHFKNGDRLTGRFERYGAGKLMFKTKNVGEVEISPDAVASFTSEQPVVVLFRKGNAVKGTFSLSQSGQWNLQREGKEPQALSQKDILGIYPVPFYSPSTTAHRIRPCLFWHGKGNLGYTVEKGDQSAKTLALGFSAVRIQPPLSGMTERFRTNYTLDALVANTSTLQGVRTRTNSVDTTLRQDFFLHHNPHNFLFLLGQLDHIEAQSLALRQTYGGGFGRDVVRSPNATFSLLGGVTYVHERFFSQPGKDKAEALGGEKLNLRVWKIGLDHQLSFYPDLTHGGQFRFDTSTVASAPVSKDLFFQVGFTDHFLSNPLPGHKRSDVIFTTGIGLNF